MVAYRILHVPTGLFYCPSRELKVTLSDDERHYANYRYVKSNLSKQGKIYARKPSLKFLGDNYYTHLISSAKQLSRYGSYCLLPVLPHEWSIVEVS